MNFKEGDEIKVQSEEYILDMVYVQEFDENLILAEEEHMGVVFVNKSNIIQED